MAGPRVSVILPVRNGERFVAEAIESVLGQDYDRLELTVVDGHSTDRTGDIVRGFPAVSYLLQEKEGIPDAWNLGIQSTDGPLLAFLSADDRWLPGKLTRQVEYMQDHAELQYTVTKFRYFLEPGCSLPPGFNPDLLDRDLVGRIMETLMVRREVFDAVGLFDPELRTAEDVDWYARAKDLGVPMAVLDETLLHKRVHDANASAEAASNTPRLLKVLRDSIRRQRAAAAGRTEPDES